MILAIVGMCGSGKSAACDYLQKKSFQRIYFGNWTLTELKKRRLEVNPANEKKVREDLRATHGMGAFAKLSIPRIQTLVNCSNKICIDGLYSWSEYLILREAFNHSIKLIQIYADKEIRYSRLAKRKDRPLSREEAEERDIAEIENIAKGGPIAFCDSLVINDAALSGLCSHLEKLLTTLERRD